MPNKNEVVLVNLYDDRYWNVFVNQKHVTKLTKEHFTNFLFKRKSRKLLADIAECSEGELSYTLIDLYAHESKADSYDSNEFDEYDDVLKFCKTYNIDPVFF